MIFDLCSLALAVSMSFQPNTIQGNTNSRQSAEKGQRVGSTITLQPFTAVSLSIFADDAVVVVDSTIEEIEDVSTENGGKSHYAPILTHSRDTEFVRDQRRENTE